MNIIGAKAEKRNYKNQFSIFCKYKILNAKEISNDKNNFIFIPHNKHKNNYWHCLFNNISQLAFISQNVKNLNVIIPNTTGKFIKEYILFLKKYYKFNLEIIDENIAIKLSGKVVFTEPSLFGEFEHNQSIGQELIEKQKNFLKEER